MNYFIEGDAANADRIKAAFQKLGIDTLDFSFNSKHRFYFTVEGKISFFYTNNELCDVIKSHQEYQELMLPSIIEPKFKVGDTIRDIVNNENRTYVIIGINYGTQHYLVNGGSISFFVQDSYEVVETDDQKWLREACDYLYKHLFTKADGAEHYVVSCQKITQTEFVQYFRNHMKEVMK